MPEILMACTSMHGGMLGKEQPDFLMLKCSLHLKTVLYTLYTGHCVSRPTTYPWSLDLPAGLSPDREASKKNGWVKKMPQFFRSQNGHEITCKIFTTLFFLLDKLDKSGASTDGHWNKWLPSLAEPHPVISSSPNWHQEWSPDAVLLHCQQWCMLHIRGEWPPPGQLVNQGRWNTDDRVMVVALSFLWHSLAELKRQSEWRVSLLGESNPPVLLLFLLDLDNRTNGGGWWVTRRRLYLID